MGQIVRKIFRPNVSVQTFRMQEGEGLFETLKSVCVCVYCLSVVDTTVVHMYDLSPLGNLYNCQIMKSTYNVLNFL